MTTITEKKEQLYKTSTMQKRSVRLAYPAGRGKIILRTEDDWDKDIEPVKISEDGDTLTFELEANKPFLYFKPCLIDENGE